MTMRCQHCGKPSAPEARNCVHCGRLAQPVVARQHGQAVRCSRCSTACVQVALGGIELDLCRACGGLWFDRSELRSFGETMADDQAATTQARDLLQELRAKHTRAERAAYLHCPVCAREMSPVNQFAISGVFVHHCDDHGTWADNAAALALIDLMANGGEADMRELEARHHRLAVDRQLQSLSSRVSSATRHIEVVDARARMHLIFDLLDLL